MRGTGEQGPCLESAQDFGGHDGIGVGCCSNVGLPDPGLTDPGLTASKPGGRDKESALRMGEVQRKKGGTQLKQPSVGYTLELGTSTRGGRLGSFSNFS